MARFTVALDCDDAVPYFLWDEPTTLGQLKERLARGDREARDYYTAKIMREARYADVWKLLSLADVAGAWERLRTRLGRRRALWEYLFDEWTRQGLLPPAAGSGAK